jgi:hypothetical protein
MANDYDPAVAIPGIRYVRLGYLTTFESGYTLTVGDRIGGNKRQAKLKPAYHSMLSSLDPTVGDREFSAGAVGLLGWLAQEGLLALVKDDDILDDLDMVPVPRRVMAFVEDLEEGYLLRVGDDEPFAISELGARFLPYMDGVRTLAEIAGLVKGEILDDPEERPTVETNEREQGRTFDSFLKEDALVLIRDMTRSGAVSFEPADSEGPIPATAPTAAEN